MTGERRREVRFVRAVCASTSGAVVEGNVYRLVDAEGKVTSLSLQRVEELVSAGTLVVRDGVCRGSDTSIAWIRRKLSDTGDVGEQHRKDVVEKGGARRNALAGPLGKLACEKGGAGFLAPYHAVAAERVAQWGERAHLQQRTTMSYDPPRVASGMKRGSAAGSVSDMAAQARRSLAQLYAHLPRECAETIIDVCMFEKGLQIIETERMWPRRSAKLVLRIGLEQLAQRMGLAPVAVGSVVFGERTWHDEGAYPTRFE